jgi:hypothetical protein
MGIETIMFAAFTGMQAIGSLMQGQAQAKAAVQQGNIDAQNMAKKTRYAAARQTVSFLNSGLTLEGTPQAVIDETYATGIKDVGQIRMNANTAASNAINAGRMEAIGTIASGFSGMGGGSMGAMFNTAGSYLPDSALFKLNESGFGSMSFNMMEAKDKRMGIY